MNWTLIWEAIYRFFFAVAEPIQTPPVVQPEELDVQVKTPEPIVEVPETKHEPVIETPAVHTNKINAWALAIQVQEGGSPDDLNMRLNNPGNLKYTKYTKSLGGQPANTATDGGVFCKFSSHELGIKALCHFLTDAASGKLKAYEPEMTLETFTRIYAQPPNLNYATRVANALSVTIHTPIKDLL